MDFRAIRLRVAVEATTEYKIMPGVYCEKRWSEEILGKREKSPRRTSQKDVRKLREHGVMEGWVERI